MLRRLAAPSVLALGLAFALSACTVLPAGDPVASDEPSPSASAEAAGPVLSECVDGTWEADLDGLVQQVAAMMAEQELSVTSASGTGSRQVTIGGEGVMGYDVDAVYEMVVDMGGGLVMTVTQHHTGTMGADWAWDGGADASDTSGTMRFENFDSDEYHVDSTVTINGQASDTQVPIPNPSGGDVPLLVTCEGDVMTTLPEGTPLLTTWARVS